MKKLFSDSEPATSENVVEFSSSAQRIYAGALSSEEESYDFLVRVLALIRAERAGITNDNAK